MRTDSEWSPGPGVKVSATNRTEGGRIVSAIMSGGARCPACGTQSSRRHGWYVRHGGCNDDSEDGGAAYLAGEGYPRPTFNSSFWLF
jgi:hypothetical protein